MIESNDFSYSKNYVMLSKMNLLKTHSAKGAFQKTICKYQNIFPFQEKLQYKFSKEKNEVR